ncbi:hypothetical protein EVAR_41649_1 [Eumeta japonica]|uniref:Uncharacterized protein n=1 Tax=Eumeta variegata TaxID=151549 RepID=A0A4C1X1F0_EUMVA|nr:hypothetical protein EVAR_41649_1 [Eumeta japonica]
MFETKLPRRALRRVSKLDEAIRRRSRTPRSFDAPAGAMIYRAADGAAPVPRPRRPAGTLHPTRWPNARWHCYNMRDQRGVKLGGRQFTYSSSWYVSAYSLVRPSFFAVHSDAAGARYRRCDDDVRHRQLGLLSEVRRRLSLTRTRNSPVAPPPLIGTKPDIFRCENYASVTGPPPALPHELFVWGITTAPSKRKL